MKTFFLLFVCLFAAHAILCGQPPDEPATVFRILYIDRPFTEEESKAISEGRISSAVELHYPSAVPGSKGKETDVAFAIQRNQISSAQTYAGSGPIVLRLSIQTSALVASIPVPQNGGDLLVILKPRQPGSLENATALVVAGGSKEFPPGNLCLVNVTGFMLAFETPQNNLIIGPDEKRVFVPEKQRMDAVPLKISADVKPSPRLIFEGAVRLSQNDRIIFVAYSPPGDTDVFRTDFFMLQPSLPPNSP